MFVLGIFVGRSSVPVRFHIKDIKEELASLKSKDEEKAKTVISKKVTRKKERLGFYEDLKENKGIKPIIKRSVSRVEGVKKRISDKDNTSKAVKKVEKKKRGFTIQVASVKDEKMAGKMVAELKKYGYSAYKTKVNIPELGLWFRVRVGHYSDKAKASSILEKLKKRKLKPILLQE
jgi:cell division protein FtsN